MESTLIEKLKTYANNHLNVMLIGSSGIGKTAITKSIADQLNLKFRYYSAPTLDPWADIVGIPKPDDETEDLKFYRPRALEQAEFVFFDELNRAHPRVLNAVLEIIQFKSINGHILPNLKMIWAAINPPGDDYQVEELDPALVDRFHIFIKMKAEISLPYLETKMKPEIAKTLKNWWDNLSKEQQKILTPRRLEYIGFMINNDIPWRDAMPQGHIFPTDELAKKIRVATCGEDELNIDRETILKRKDAFLQKLRKEPSLAIPIVNVMKRFDENELFECRDLLESMPKELVHKLGVDKFVLVKKPFKSLFVSNSVDISKYPKIASAFEFDQIK